MLTSSLDLGFSNPWAISSLGIYGPRALYAFADADWRPPCSAGSDVRSEGLLVLAGWGRMLNSGCVSWASLLDCGCLG